MPSLAQTILLFSAFVGILAHTDSYHTCVHDKLDHKIESIDVPDDSDFEGRGLQSYSNIRILFDFTSGGLDQTPDDFQNYIKNTIIPPVQNIFQAALKVKPISGNLMAQKQTTMCSGSIQVPDYYNSVGVPADLVLFVDTVNDSSQGYAAFAGACLQSSKNGRPLFGRIVYNMAKVKASTNAVSIEKDITISLHEITHALGFTSSLFSSYINPVTGAKLTGHVLNRIVNGQTITVLNVEPLTSMLKDYYGCQTLEGAYLENEGGSGSKNSHFERRVFYNEYMTASTLQDFRMTAFSLALLEGTGWYQADYSMAEPMTWGKGKGCIFLDWPCVDFNSKAIKFDEFCSSLTKMQCSWTGRVAGSCGSGSIKINTVLNDAINYWGNDTVVNDQFMDNCPVPDLYNNLDCENEGNQDKSTLPTQESYGMGSKCFIGTLITPGRIAAPFGYCFKPTCTLQADGTYNLKVNVGSNVVQCTSANDQLSVPGLSGKLYCPDPNTFCTRINAEGFCRRGCSARGTCVDRTCQCKDGWGGYDCSKQIYTDKCAACSGQDALKTTCFGDTCVQPVSSGSGSTDQTPDNTPTTTTTPTGTTTTSTSTSDNTNTNTPQTTSTSTNSNPSTTSPTSTNTQTNTSTTTTSSPSTTTTTTPSTGTNTTVDSKTTSTPTTTNTTTTATPTQTTTNSPSSTSSSPSTTSNSNTSTGSNTNSTSSTPTTTKTTTTTTTTTTNNNTSSTPTQSSPTTTSSTPSSTTTTTTTTTTTNTSNPTSTGGSTSTGKNWWTKSSNSTTTTTTTSSNSTVYKMVPDGAGGVSREKDGEPSTDTTNNQTSDNKSDNGVNIGLIVGLAVGGLVILVVGIYFGLKCARNYKKNTATRKPSLKKANSIANPTLKRQMTENPNKYAYVP